jgi:hypothetical protein
MAKAVRIFQEVTPSHCHEVSPHYLITPSRMCGPSLKSSTSLSWPKPNISAPPAVFSVLVPPRKTPPSSRGGFWGSAHAINFVEWSGLRLTNRLHVHHLAQWSIGHGLEARFTLFWVDAHIQTTPITSSLIKYLLKIGHGHGFNSPIDCTSRINILLAPPPNRGQAWGLLCAIDIFLNSTCWVPSWYFSTTYFCWGKHYLVWGFRLFIVSARISSTWSHTVVCMKSYMLLHVSDFVLQVVKVVQSLVNPHNGCHVILYRSFLAQHDVQCIGYKIPNLIHDDDWGGCSCLHVEQFYTMHPLYYISWLCKVRPFYTLPFFSSSF